MNFGRINTQTLFFYLAMAALAAILGILGMRLASSTNPDIEPFDQGAYLGMAKTLRSEWFPASTDGTRNPLFPWLAARVFDPKADGFFAKGKQFNIALAVMGIVLIGALSRRRLGSLGAWNLAALAGLGCLLPIGTFFGAEVLFYLFFFGMWVAAIGFFRNARLMWALGMGLCSGLAYLAKPSTGPFLGVFAFVLAAAMLVNFWLHRPSWWLPSDLRLPVALLAIALVFGSYFGIIAPRLIMAHKTFGSAFYSLPSFWFWADDWETCVTKYANCTAHGLAQLPKEEWPTMGNYFRRHPPGDILARGMEGTGIKLRQLIMPDRRWPWESESRSHPKSLVLPARGWYLVFLGCVAAGLLAWTGFRPVLSPGAVVTLTFCMIVFWLYTGAYGWYHPIGPGFRFVMMFYIPLAWSFLSIARMCSESGWQRHVYAATNVLLASLMVWRMAGLMLDTTFKKIGYAF